MLSNFPPFPLNFCFYVLFRNPFWSGDHKVFLFLKVFKILFYHIYVFDPSGIYIYGWYEVGIQCCFHVENKFSFDLDSLPYLRDFPQMHVHGWVAGLSTLQFERKAKRITRFSFYWLTLTLHTPLLFPLQWPELSHEAICSTKGD